MIFMLLLMILMVLMQVPYQSTWIDWGSIPETQRRNNMHLIFQTDPFILDYRCQVKKVKLYV